MAEITEMSLSELEVMLEELKERMRTEELSDEDKAQIEAQVKTVQDQIEVLSLKAMQAAREAAGLDNPAPMY